MTELLGAKLKPQTTERVASSDPFLRRGNHREDYPEATCAVCLPAGPAPVQSAVSARRTLLTRARIAPKAIAASFGPTPEIVPKSFLGINDLRVSQRWHRVGRGGATTCLPGSVAADGARARPILAVRPTPRIEPPQYFGLPVIHTPPRTAPQRYSDDNVRWRVIDRC